MSDQDNQRYALAAAAAAAAYAQKKARDEARKALIISTALNQNMSSLDPKTQEDLQQLLQAEARRVRQENFEWKLGMWAVGILVGGFILFWLFVFGRSCSSHSYGAASASTSYVAATPQGPPDRTLVSRVKVGTKIRWNNFEGKVRAVSEDAITMDWGGTFTINGLAERLNTGEAVIVAH